MSGATPRRDWVTTAFFGFMLASLAAVAFASGEWLFGFASGLLLALLVSAAVLFFPPDGPGPRATLLLSIASLVAGVCAEVVAFSDYQGELSTPLWVFGLYFVIGGLVGVYKSRKTTVKERA